MNTELSDVYQKLSLKNNIPVSEFIIFCLNDASVTGELNLKRTTISNTSCSLVAETLKRVRTIKILNLADCLLKFDGLKYFLDVVNQQKSLSLLNLKGNKIGNNITLYVANVMLTNYSITELRLDWNTMGDTVDTFAQLCNNLLSNTVLTTLNLSNNNLSQESSFHLAKIINTNRCLKYIDLSWNQIGEEGAVLLMKSLKNNDTLVILNIQGNSVSDKTTEMIYEQLKQNKSNVINQINIQNRNIGLLEHAVSADKNYQTQLTSLNSQYQSHIDELQSKLRFLQIENQQKQLELDEIKNNSIKEKESNINIINQVEKIKSELSFHKKSFSSLIKKISNEVSNSDVETMESLEGFEKVIYIIKQIKYRCVSKIKKETTLNKKKLEEALPRLTNELNALKLELKNLKTLTDTEIRNYTDELAATKGLLHKNMYHLKMSNTINNEMNKKHLMEQQKDANTLDEKVLHQATVLVVLNETIKLIQEEKKDLQAKLEELKENLIILQDEKKVLRSKFEELKEKTTPNIHIIQTLEKSLNMAKDELNTFHENQLSKMAAHDLETQLSADAFTREKDILDLKLNEKQRELEFCETAKIQMNINHNSEISILEQQLQSEKLKFIKKRKENAKRIDELYFTLTQQIDKLRKENLDISNHEESY